MELWYISATIDISGCLIQLLWFQMGKPSGQKANVDQEWKLCVSNSQTHRPVVCQVPRSMGFLQARILE